MHFMWSTRYGNNQPLTLTLTLTLTLFSSPLILSPSVVTSVDLLVKWPSPSSPSPPPSSKPPL